MTLFHPIALGAVLAAALPTIPQEGPPASGGPAARPADEGGAPIPGDLPDEVREALAMLEARLRVRESRVLEARRLLEMERDVLATIDQQRPSGAISPRQRELVEVRHAWAAALVEAREAERDEVAIRLESLRRTIASPSPESDRAELRARLDDEVRIRQAELRAREARLKAAEAQVAFEEGSQRNFVDAVQGGVAAVGAARQAMFRLSEAISWRDTMAGERDIARLELESAVRRLAQFDDPESTDPTLGRDDPADREARLAALEHTVDLLKDEMYQMQWELQIFRNMQHERFGMYDR